MEEVRNAHHQVSWRPFGRENIRRDLWGHGLIFLPFFLRMSALIPNRNGQNPFGMIGGLVFGLFAPIFYAVMGFVMGAISAFLYNLLAKWVGGIQVQAQTQPSTGLPA